MNQLKNRYRVVRRGWGVYYAFNNETGNSESLKTRNRAEADRLVHAMNEAVRLTQLNMQIARAYLNASDPEITKRTWQYVLNITGSLPVRATWNAAISANCAGTWAAPSPT